MKVIVTGGAGFIGANLCRALAAQPGIRRVVALDDLSTGFESNLDGVDCDLVIGSFLDESSLDVAMKGVDAVVHLGARPSVPKSLADPLAAQHINDTGTVRVLEAARRAGNAHVVLASSSSVYGANPTLPKREDLAPMPMSPYAASKLAAESYALAYQHSFGLPVLAFRFFNVFGPLQAAGHAYAAVVPAFATAALKGEPIPVHGDGLQSRDFTYVDTVAAIITDALVRNVVCSSPVNLAFGTRTDLMAVVALIGDILGTELVVEHLPARIGDVRHSQADSGALLSLFPEVEAVSLREGLSATLEWLATRL